MKFALVTLLLLVVGAALFLIPRRTPPAAPAPRLPTAPPGPAVDRRRSEPESAQPGPPELETFRMQRAADVSVDRQQAIVTLFRNVPRPPKLLHHLLSPAFVSAASSAELVDLIAGEPQIAARVLATVNSPFYALKTPVQSIGQAVSYLGLNAVRSVCLQYLLIDAFKPDSPQRKQVLDAIWRASAIASELTQHLAQRLAYPDQGALASAVVLSHLGRLATASAMPPGVLATIPDRGLLERVRAEQQAMGLASPEVGRLLMMHWELPLAIVEEAAAVDSILVTPDSRATAADAARPPRLALGYLCARLGERLAEARPLALSSFDLRTDLGLDGHHLQGYLGDAHRERLAGLLRSPELQAAVQRILSTATAMTAA
jgi:HD-like signal output (HDOD) protein